jgi:hypothetical protein
MTQDPLKLGRIVAILAWIWFALDATIAAAALLRMVALDVAGNDAIVRSVEIVDRFVGVGYIIAFLCVAVAVLRWLYVVNRNAQSWSDAVTITPGWNVGWFFVPVASLWKPFQAIRELRAATIDPDDPASVVTPDWLRWWWGLWIASNAVGQVSARLHLAAETPEAATRIDWLTIVTVAIDLPLVILLIRLVREISSCQHHRLT